MRNNLRPELQRITGIPTKIEDQGRYFGAYVTLAIRGTRAKFTPVKIVAVYPEADIRCFSQARETGTAITFYCREEQALPLSRVL